MRFLSRNALSMLVVTCALLVAKNGLAAPVVFAGNGHAYELITELADYPTAVTAATLVPAPAGFGQGHLVTISDASENSFLTTTFGPSFPISSDISVWIGFSDVLVEGEWRWIDDTPGIYQDADNFASPIQTAYQNFHPAEPNDTGGNEDGGKLRATGIWNDEPITNLSGYIVEYEAVPEPSTFALAFLGLLGLGFCTWRRRKRA